MESTKPFPIGLTFDDVLLVPQRFSGGSRSEITVHSRFSRTIELEIPVVSSNMDTVTEAGMAIAMARSGGIGVIHRFLPTEVQVREIEKVKRAQNFIIEEPYTLRPTDTLAIAQSLMKTKEVSGLLVTDENNHLVGILTRRDLRFLHNNHQDPVSEFMTPKDAMVVASPDITMADAKEMLRKHRVEKLPLVTTSGLLSGLITSVDIERSEDSPIATKDERGRLRVAAAIGVKGDAIPRSTALLKAGVDALVVDIAHGHSDLAIDTVRKLRSEFGDEIQVVAGNVATREGTEDLIAAGADSIKVGVGPGSICVTRVVTGSGMPQLTAVLESASVAKEHGVPVIADGGIRTSGDVCKAIAAGASTVMLGNLLAGTTESPGFPIIRNGRKVKVIRGMAGLGAALGRESKKGAFDDDFSNFADFVPEGVEAVVPYRGSVSEVIGQLIGGLRSGISYCGSSSIPEMQDKSRFIRITNSGVVESKSHDVAQV